MNLENLKAKTAHIALTLMGCLLVVLSAYGQQSREGFGKNRMQYKQFDWKYYSSDNFDVYFYGANREMAKSTSEFLEGEFDRITDIIGYPPYNKTKVFLYQSVIDLQQSNVGLTEASYTISGQTKFVKSYVEVANPGTSDGLKEELLLKVTQLLVDDMMFGGSLTEMFQSAYLLNLPEWFVKGIARYIAKGWDEDMDDYIREFVGSKKVRKATKMSGKQAEVIGQSIWNFIAEKYGKSNISNILNYTRIIRNEEKSVEVTLGMNFKQVMAEWKNFYGEMDLQIDENYVAPNEELKISKNNRKGLTYHQIKLSPDGSKLAYASNDGGKYMVKIRFLDSNKEKKVISGGYKVINQEIDPNLPLIAWIDDKTLGLITGKRGRHIFSIYDLDTDSRLLRPMDRFSQINSIDFSSSGKLGVFSADVNGHNDIYLISTKRDRVKRLTSDVYDDIAPYFIPDTNEIIFSSNRETNALKPEGREYEDLPDNFNLFHYSLDTTANELVRLTNTVSRDAMPKSDEQGNVYYLSDQKGITNLFRYTHSTKLFHQISNFKYSIKEFDINVATGRLVYVMLEKGEEHIFIDNAFDFDKNTFTPASTRWQVKQAKLMVERRALLNKVTAEKKTISEKKTEISDKPEQETENASEETEADTGLIDTDNYVFDKVIKQEPEVSNNTSNTSFLSKYRKVRKESSISGPFPYDTKFNADNLVTTWVIDPLRGFGISLETQMNDMLENHRFHGGITTTTNLKNGDIYGQYEFLKYLIDFNVRYDRNVYYFDSERLKQRYSKNTLEVGAALPLNVKTRITLNPFFTRTKFANLLPTGLPPIFDAPIAVDYLGFRSELIYDNSTVKNLNHIEGTRAKVSLENYNALGDAESSFSNISVDVRHYQKVHREITFATRFFYGKFFGNSPKKYLLGGMDNWLLNKENTEGTGNPLFFGDQSNVDKSELLFVEYATSLRGFDYAELFGTDVLLFNAELRIPLIRYLHSGPISSNFFRNLQFVTFYDMGSSWTGVSPFKRANSVNTVSSPGGSQGELGLFRYTLRNFQNPWLYSYGVGLRTVLLGYYMKFDLAWPVEDYRTLPPRLFITLGYDF